MAHVEEPPRQGWPWFAVWALGGFVFALGTVVLGTLFLIVAVPALGWALWKSTARTEAVGLVAGAGAMMLLAAFLNRNSIACPASGKIQLPATAERLPGADISCGGADPTPWLVGGVLATAIGIALYWLLKPRDT